MEKVKWYQILIMLWISISTISQIQIAPALMSRADRDTWIAIIFTVFPFLLFIFALWFIMKKSDEQHIYDWLKQKTNRFFSGAIISILCAVLFISSYAALKDIITWTTSTYLLYRPSVLLVVMFVLLCYYLASSGIQTIVITAGVFFPLHLLLSILVYSWAFSYDNFYRIFPIFEHGFQSIAYGMMYSLAAFINIFSMLFLQHKTKEKIKLKWIMMLGVFLVIDLLVSNIMGHAEFGPKETSRQRYPIYEQWRIVEVGRYIEHLDFFVIFEWLSGVMIQISIHLYIMLELITRIFKRINRIALLRVICLALVMSYYLPLNDVYFFYIMENYFFSSVLAIYILLTIIFLFIPKHKKSG